MKKIWGFFRRFLHNLAHLAKLEAFRPFDAYDTKRARIIGCECGKVFYQSKGSEDLMVAFQMFTKKEDP